MMTNNEEKIYTAEELAEELNRSVSTIKRAFLVLQKNLAKQGIMVSRCGRGKNARYKVRYEFKEV